MRSILDQLERHTNAVFWSDGLLDLLAGLAVVAIGLGWIGDLVALGAVAPGLFIPLWSVLRRRVVEPRRGYLELGDERQRDHARLTRGLLVVGVGSLLVGVSVFVVGVDAAVLVRAMPGSLVGLAALATAATLELRRFAGYALVLVGVGVGSGLLGYNPGWAFVAGGAVAATVGTGLLVRLLRRYPRARPVELQPEAPQ